MKLTLVLACALFALVLAPTTATAAPYTVVTYNLGLLRAFGADYVPAVDARTKAAPAALARLVSDARPHVLLLEEVWEDRAADAIAKELSPLGYTVVHPDVHTIIGLSSGLLLCVAQPLKVVGWKFTPFQRTTFTDGFARKGILEATIEDTSDGARFALVGTHTVAVDTNAGVPKDKGQVDAIMAQAEQIRAIIAARASGGTAGGAGAPAASGAAASGAVGSVASNGVGAAAGATAASEAASGGKGAPAGGASTKAAAAGGTASNGVGAAAGATTVNGAASRGSGAPAGGSAAGVDAAVALPAGAASSPPALATAPGAARVAASFQAAAVPVLLLGDFNVGPGYADAVYQRFATMSGIREAGATLFPGAPLVTWDPGNPLVKYGNYPNEPAAKIDHVFLLDGSALRWLPTAARVLMTDPVPGLAITPKGASTPVPVPLSDHYAFLTVVELSPVAAQ